MRRLLGNDNWYILQEKWTGKEQSQVEEGGGGGAKMDTLHMYIQASFDDEYYLQT